MEAVKRREVKGVQEKIMQEKEQKNKFHRRGQRVTCKRCRESRSNNHAKGHTRKDGCLFRGIPIEYEDRSPQEHDEHKKRCEEVKWWRSHEARCKEADAAIDGYFKALKEEEEVTVSTAPVAVSAGRGRPPAPQAAQAAQKAAQAVHQQANAGDGEKEEDCWC